MSTRTGAGDWLVGGYELAWRGFKACCALVAFAGASIILALLAAFVAVGWAEKRISKGANNDEA
jgi:hypothetical protein